VEPNRTKAQYYALVLSKTKPIDIMSLYIKLRNKTMPIKRSLLEKKWYYRVAKVFFQVLPLPTVVIVFLKSGITIPEISQKNIPTILQANINNIVYAVIGLVVYYLILKMIWGSFLYIAFGGLEDDTMKKDGVTIDQPKGQISQSAAPSGHGAIPDKDKKEIGFYVFILIMIGLVYWIYSYQSPTPKPNYNNTCIPTGCGDLWRCDGSYYDANGVRRSLHACLPRKAGETYPSWSGTCRQCP